MLDKDDKTGELYTSAVSDDPQDVATCGDDPDAVESNSSNYGGSSLADKPIEERVLRDD